MKKLVWILISLLVGISLYAESVMMIGDSHVAVKIYPQTVDSILKCNADSCTFSFFGINGASFATYCKPENLDTIFKTRPEVLIIHLGTNDCYTTRFNRETFRANLTQFYDSIHLQLPETKLIFVTPFVNKLKFRTRKKRRYSWQVNINTAPCADIINNFCGDHAEARCIDYYALHGKEFINSPLISRDNVHLTAPGYCRMGCQVAEELLKITGLFKAAPQPSDSIPTI